MSRFAPALRSVARELDVPPAARAAILLEMAADLEAVYERHRQAGAGEEEAVRRAEEMVLGSADVLRRLGRIHRGSWRVWSAGMGERLGGGADLVLLAVAVAPVLVASTAVSVRTLATSAEPLAWPLAILAVAITAVIALEAGRIVGGGRGGTAGLPLLLVLAGLAPAFGMLAATLTAWSATRTLASAGSAALDAEILARIGTAGALLLAGLLLGIAAALTWFVLLSRAGVQAARQVDRILGGDVGGGHGVVADNSIIPLVRRRRRK
jgi:hypothetical protein